MLRLGALRRLPGFNPFLVRASVYWAEDTGVDEPDEGEVFQSLLSQGISLLQRGLPSSRRALAGRFQSLLSQGISLLGAGAGARWD